MATYVQALEKESELLTQILEFYDKILQDYENLLQDYRERMMDQKSDYEKKIIELKKRLGLPT